MRDCVVRVLCLAGVASGAAAQPCGWDGSAGSPGAAGGYVDPLIFWDDGRGPDLYLGGSFASFGGLAEDFVVKVESADGSVHNLGTGINFGLSNAFVTSFQPFNPGSGEELVVGGFWDSVGDLPMSSSISRWNGREWININAGWDSTNRGSVWALTVWNNELYVGGGYTGIGGMTGNNGIAKWDGSTWHPVGGGYTTGIAPNVFALQVFDDGSGEKLYAAGRFTTFDNLPTSAIVVRWNGASWETIGGGVERGATLAGAECMTVFDDGHGPALYVGGRDLRLAGVSFNVVKWDGVQWSGVGQNLGPRTTSLVVWDDGTGPALYAGGTQGASGLLTRLEGGMWVTYDGGVGGTGVDGTGTPSIFGLLTDGDTLYVAGTFTGVGAGAAESAFGLATHGAACPECPADLSGSSDPNDLAYGLPDGLVDSADFFYFLDQFVFGVTSVADLTGSSDPNDPAYGVPDGLIDASDFFFYLDLFVQGCP